MASLDDRLKRLEATLSPGAGVVPADQQQALQDYFDTLEGRPVPERHDPALDAYFAQLEEFERQREERQAWEA